MSKNNFNYMIAIYFEDNELIKQVHKNRMSNLLKGCYYVYITKDWFKICVVQPLWAINRDGLYYKIL